MSIRSWIIGLSSAIPVMLAVSTSAAESSPHATKEEVLSKVHAAAELLAADGLVALPIIADPDGEFVWKDTYVFVVNCDADRVMANPRFPERVGGDLKQHTDYAGFRYGTSLCEKAALPEGGWITYQWPRSGSSEPMTKTSFVLSVPGMPLQVGAGVYVDDQYLDDMRDQYLKRQHTENRHGEDLRDDDSK